jgi:uncharacterized membrane protein YhaH (DUF805 family)
LETKDYFHTAAEGQQGPSLLRRVLTIWSFRGRIGRSAFWVESAFCLLLGLLGEFLTGPLAYDSRKASNPSFILFLPFIALTWISIAATVKRWHDLDRSGWMTLLNLAVIPLPFTFIYTYFFRGTQGRNRFGPDPVANRNQSYLGTSNKIED